MNDGSAVPDGSARLDRWERQVSQRINEPNCCLKTAREKIDSLKINKMILRAARGLSDYNSFQQNFCTSWGRNVHDCQSNLPNRQESPERTLRGPGKLSITAFAKLGGTNSFEFDLIQRAQSVHATFALPFEPKAYTADVPVVPIRNLLKQRILTRGRN